MTKFKDLKLKTKLFLGFSVVGISIVIMGFIIFNAIVDIQEQNERVRINTTLLGAVNQVKSTVLTDMLNINNIVELKEYDSVHKYMNKHFQAQKVYTKNDEIVTAIIKDSISDLDQMDKIIKLTENYQRIHKTNFENHFQPAYDTMLVYLDYYWQVENETFTEPEEFARKRQKILKDQRKEPLFICFSSGQQLFRIISDLEEALKSQLNEAQVQISGIIKQTMIITTVMIIVALLIAIMVSASLAQLMVNPVLKVMEFLSAIANGVLPKEKLRESKDEIGKMSEQINNHITNLRACTEFAEEIGSGHLDIEFEATDALGLTLIQMQNKLRTVAQEEKKRNYISEGLEKVNQILRSDNNLEQISDDLIKTLVKYVNGCMGSVFIAETGESESTIINLIACYAYEKKKYLDKTILPGQGLTGQAYVEREIIFLKKIPENYANITSGLGTGKPNYVIIIPLKTDREIEGILEIAGFYALEDYHVNFLEQAAGVIAAAIGRIKINETNEQLSNI